MASFKGEVTVVTQGRRRDAKRFARRRPAPAPALIAILTLLTLAACGGTAAPATVSVPTSAATTGGGEVEPTSVGPTDGSGGDGATGSGEEFCLNTVEEVSAALEVDVTDTTSFENPGSGGGCGYTDADGGPIYAISVAIGDQAAAAFDAYRQLEGAEEISGIGDAAVYAPFNEIPGVAFSKGGATYGVIGSPRLLELPISDDPAALRSAIEELARQAADGA